MNIKIVYILLAFLVLSACQFETGDDPVVEKPERYIWVFAQFNVPEEENKTYSYWYYGKIRESLYESIAHNTIKIGFLLLSETHYWRDDTLIPYEDDDDTGELIFRIEDIRRITRIKRLPKVPAQHEYIQSKAEEEGAG